MSLDRSPKQRQRLTVERVESKLTGLRREPGFVSRAARYALAYERWLLGMRKWKPVPIHYELTSEEASRIRVLLRFDHSGRS